MVALIALAAFGLVLVLARRLRAVAERVDMFLPASDPGLPHPGTPLPPFSAAAVDGALVTHEDFAGADRVLALLTTDCSSCHDQVPALRELGATEPRPVVVVIGPPEHRTPMIAQLAHHAVILVEDSPRGPIVDGLDVHEFPAVIVVGNGVVRTAGHGVAAVTAPAGSPA